MPDRIKRMIAFVIDWNILYLPTLLISLLIAEMASNNSDAILAVFAMMFLLFATMALIAARDVIFAGRSLGKRIFGLYVVDKKTLEPISTGRRFARNIFFMLVNWVEIILLLATGETLGDRVTSASVLSRQKLDRMREEMAAEQGGEAEDFFLSADGFSPAAQPTEAVPASAPRTHTQPRKQLPAQVLLPLIAGIVIVCIIAFVGLIQIVLHANRNTEQAQLAYDYVVSSHAFATADLDPDDLRMNEYSVSHITQDGVRTSTTEITFTVRRGLFRRYAFYVTCHKEGDVWTVCEDCTRIVCSGVGKNT